MIALNAGAAIYLSGVCESFEQGINRAQDVIRSGKALEKLKELVNLTATFSEETSH